MSTCTVLVQLLKIIIPHSNRYQLPKLKSCACRKMLCNLLIDMPCLKKNNQTNSINQVFDYYWLRPSTRDMPIKNVTISPVPVLSLTRHPKHLLFPRNYSFHLTMTYLQTDLSKHWGLQSKNAFPDSQIENRPSYLLAKLHLFHYYHREHLAPNMQPLIVCTVNYVSTLIFYYTGKSISRTWLMLLLIYKIILYK